MKKILFTFFSSFWLLALFSLPVRADQITHTVSFNPNCLEFEDVTIDSVDYTTIQYIGLNNIGEPGTPELPCLYLQFSVPYDAINLAVQSSSQSGYSYVLSHPVLPAIEDVSVNDSVMPPIVPDMTIYGSNAFLPMDHAEIVSDSYYMGENRVVTVKVLPMRYAAGRNRIRLYDNVTVTLGYNRANSNQFPANMSTQSNLALRQQSWDELKTRVVNPNQVESFAPVYTNPQQLQAPLPEYMTDSIWIEERFITQLNNSCEYMIVTTRDLAPSFRRLAALKRQKGYMVGIRCIEDILADNMVQNGDKRIKKDSTFTYINDDAGKLREYLRIHHSLFGTKYVLLAGLEIPIRYGYKDISQTNHNTNIPIPTDWYFSDLTTNWNTNGNSFYGEYNQYSVEQFDYEAELFVGRLMVSTEEEINAYINKLFIYELNPGNGNSDYLNRALFVTGSQDPSFVNPCSELRDSLSSIYSDVNAINNLSSSYPTGSDVVRDINQTNYGFLTINGHGSPHNICVNQALNPVTGYYKQNYYLYTKYLDRGVPEENCNGLDSLSNSKFPGVFYSYACDNMPFDIFTEPSNNHTYYGYNMGQEYTLDLNRGGIAYLGNTRSGLMQSSPVLMGDFIKELSRGIHHVGMTETYSKRLFGRKSKYLIMSHNLMGEPEFSIWTTSPVPFQNITISRTNNTTIVSGLPVGEKCMVGICGNSGYAISKSTTTGSLTFNDVYPNTTLMVTSDQHLPYIAPTFIQNTIINNSQYVIATNYTAGSNVDSNLNTGDVVIKNGVDYVVEHSGTVTLAPGFNIQKGAKFATSRSKYR